MPSQAGECGGREGMRPIPAGVYRLGSDRHYPEEGPVRDVALRDFWIDCIPVTNASYAVFTAETGYVTVAERPLDPAAYPGVATADLRPGALVFCMTAGPVSLGNVSQWWSYVPGACWRSPEGPGSDLAGRERHPVVHVAYEDAAAYAAWAGKALPSEGQWEAAARGGLVGAEYAWGEAFTPGGRRMAKTWDGAFPWRSLAGEGLTRTAPVASYPANGYGLYDMIGNVREWTTDWYAPRREGRSSPGCCGPDRRAGAPPPASFDPASAVRIPHKVLKGGSFLCAPEYCRRYRPAARSPQMIDTGTSHIGFRCVSP